MKIQETIDYQIRGTLFAMRRMYNILAAQMNITQGVGYVLINVPKGGVAATQIAPLMGMSANSLSRLLKTMEEDQLIFRQKDEIDRRVVHIFLTEKGTQLRKQARQVVIDFNKKILPQISENELQAFVKVCELIKTMVSVELDRKTYPDNI